MYGKEREVSKRNKKREEIFHSWSLLIPKLHCMFYILYFGSTGSCFIPDCTGKNIQRNFE